MTWGIRGQYGHETGAMMAGVLVGLVLVTLFCRQASSLFTARAVAMAALGISVGGSMTYGQTVGLTHDAELTHNVAALRWGLLGLAVKGSVWIGMSGVFFSMALSSIRYRPLEWALVLMSALFLMFLGVELLNRPFSPSAQELPRIYFSDMWYWEPDKVDLKPRPERWGGLLFASVGIYLYASIVRRDGLVRRFAPWAFLGGAIGFPLGQSIQAYHAWYPEVFANSRLSGYFEYFNWWNMMETTFGATMGALFGLGLWLNRRLIDPGNDPQAAVISPAAEWGLAAIHVAAVAAWNFGSYQALDLFADKALTMVMLPVVVTMAGRIFPYLVVLPIVAMPIAGKTLREMSYYTDKYSDAFGWWVLFILPMVATAIAAVLFARGARLNRDATRFAPAALILATWTYFLLNHVFFEFPYPWHEDGWTNRTPNDLIYAACAICLTIFAIAALSRPGSGRPTVTDISPASSSGSAPQSAAT